MRPTLPLLMDIGFPAIARTALETLQVNLGYRCNQSCLHCHVAAGPNRVEMMARETVDAVLNFLAAQKPKVLDLTGGAPELNPHFRYFVESARGLGLSVVDRCNLTVLEEPGLGDMDQFMVSNEVSIVASLPCYLEENVNRQRGGGVFSASIRGLRRLNALGYGHEGSGLSLDLVYNPQGPVLPPPQAGLETAYKAELFERFGIVFNRLLTLANMPIQRFGSSLLSNGQFGDYMALLQSAHREENLGRVMCRSLLSIDWQGFVYDCDFNQMLGLPYGSDGQTRTHISDLIHEDFAGTPIRVAGHCYGCTAGQGSSCQGALAAAS